MSSHVLYAEWVLVAVSIAYAALVAVIGVVLALYLHVRSRALRLLAGTIAWLAFMLLVGQHLPFIEAFAPENYCFGTPGVLHYISYALPLAAAVWVSRLPVGEEGVEQTAA